MIRLRDLLTEGKFTVTYEPDSPVGFKIDCEFPQKVVEKIDAFGVYNNPRGIPKLDPFVYGWYLMNRYNKDVIVNIRTQDYTLPLFQSTLWGGYLLGIRNLLLVTGDYHPGSPFLIDVTEGITGIRKYLNEGYRIPPLTGKAKKYYNRFLSGEFERKRAKGATDFFVGAVLTPGRKGEKRIYKKKLEAGAQFFITQLVYDAEIIKKFLEDVEPEVPVLVGTAPIKTMKRIKFLKKLGIQGLSDRIIKELKSSEDIGEKCVELCSNMYQELRDFAREYGIKTGAHIMSIKNPVEAGKIIERIEK